MGVAGLAEISFRRPTDWFAASKSGSNLSDAFLLMTQLFNDPEYLKYSLAIIALLRWMLLCLKTKIILNLRDNFTTAWFISIRILSWWLVGTDITFVALLIHFSSRCQDKFKAVDFPERYAMFPTCAHVQLYTCIISINMILDVLSKLLDPSTMQYSRSRWTSSLLVCNILPVRPSHQGKGRQLQIWAPWAGLRGPTGVRHGVNYL